VGDATRIGYKPENGLVLPVVQGNGPLLVSHNLCSPDGNLSTGKVLVQMADFAACPPLRRLASVKAGRRRLDGSDLAKRWGWTECDDRIWARSEKATRNAVNACKCKRKMSSKEPRGSLKQKSIGAKKGAR
jgi:hypothetical protein